MSFAAFIPRHVFWTLQDPLNIVYALYCGKLPQLENILHCMRYIFGRLRPLWLENTKKRGSSAARKVAEMLKLLWKEEGKKETETEEDEKRRKN